MKPEQVLSILYMHQVLLFTEITKKYHTAQMIRLIIRFLSMPQQRNLTSFLHMHILNFTVSLQPDFVFSRYTVLWDVLIWHISDLLISSVPEIR